MININELKRKKATIIEELRAMMNAAEAENRELSEEEKKIYDNKITEAEKLADDIVREERLQRQEMLQAQRIEQVEREDRYGEFRSLAEFIATIRFNPADPRLVERRQSSSSLAQVGVPEQGGYLVPTQFSADILKISPEEAIVRPRAQVIPAGYPPDATLHIPALDYSEGMFGGVTVSWIAEAAEKPASKPEFKRIELTPYEVAGTLHVTDKLLRNTDAFEPLARNLLRGAIINAEETAFLVGSGTGQPTGIIGHSSNQLIRRTEAGTITYTDIINMYSAKLVGGAYCWIASQTALPALMALQDPAGHLVWQPNAREGAPGTLLGYPCLVTGKTPSLGSAGDLVLADLKYYLIKDGSGIFIDASPHFRFTENITVVKVTWNVDGKPWLSAPVQVGESTVSPFVVLDVAEGE